MGAVKNNRKIKKKIAQRGSMSNSRTACLGPYTTSAVTTFHQLQQALEQAPSWNGS